MKTRLFIEENEIELTEDVSFALNKQFESLENPTIIINKNKKEQYEKDEKILQQNIKGKSND